MAEFISKHSIKIQVGVLLSFIIAVIYWTSVASKYTYTVEENQIRISRNIESIERLKDKLNTLATKDDLKILKQDIKDFIKQ